MASAANIGNVWQRNGWPRPYQRSQHVAGSVAATSSGAVSVSIIIVACNGNIGSESQWRNSSKRRLWHAGIGIMAASSSSASSRSQQRRNNVSAQCGVAIVSKRSGKRNVVSVAWRLGRSGINGYQR